MNLRRNRYTILGELLRDLHERHHLQMRMTIAAVLDDLPDYHVELHVEGPGRIVSVDTRDDND